MIEFTCQMCAQLYKVSDDKAGKRTKCKRCQKALVVPQPPAAPQLVLAKGGARRPNSLSMLLTFVGVIGFLVVMLVVAKIATTEREVQPIIVPQAPPKPHVDSDEDKVRRVVEEWLNDQKTGGDGRRFWHADDVNYSANFSKFIALRSYEILRATTRPAATSETAYGYDAGSNVYIRTESSNRAGTPVIKDWVVYVMRKDGHWALLNYQAH